MQPVKRIALAAALVLAGAAGCSDQTPHEANTKDYLELRTKLNGVLATVQDEASLEAALPRLEALNQRIKLNVEAQAALGAEAEEQRRKALAKFKSEIEAQSHAFGDHISRIRKIEGLSPEALRKLLDAIKDVPPES